MGTIRLGDVAPILQQSPQKAILIFTNGLETVGVFYSPTLPIILQCVPQNWEL